MSSRHEPPPQRRSHAPALGTASLVLGLAVGLGLRAVPAKAGSPLFPELERLAEGHGPVRLPPPPICTLQGLAERVGTRETVRSVERHRYHCIEGTATNTTILNDGGSLERSGYLYKSGCGTDAFHEETKLEVRSGTYTWDDVWALARACGGQDLGFLSALHAPQPSRGTHPDGGTWRVERKNGALELRLDLEPDGLAHSYWLTFQPRVPSGFVIQTVQGG